MAGQGQLNAQITADGAGAVDGDFEGAFFGFGFFPGLIHGDGILVGIAMDNGKIRVWIDLGAELVAGNFAGSRFLDAENVLGWAAAGFVQPGPDVALFDVANPGQRRLAADDFNGAFNAGAKSTRTGQPNV